MADRRRLGTRDMTITLAVVLVVVALIALYGGQVAFAPGAKPSTGVTPTADVTAGFQHAANTLGFPVTVPRDVPASWHPNSLSVSDPTASGGTSQDGLTDVGTLPAVRGGWLTPDERFIEIVEAGGDAGQILLSEFGGGRTLGSVVQAGGAEWHTTTGVRSEVAWVRTVQSPSGMTSFLITGNASEQDFRALAAAVAAAG